MLEQSVASMQHFITSGQRPDTLRARGHLVTASLVKFSGSGILIGGGLW
jgi:hypothetical protein